MNQKDLFRASCVVTHNESNILLHQRSSASIIEDVSFKAVMQRIFIMSHKYYQSDLSVRRRNWHHKKIRLGQSRVGVSVGVPWKQDPVGLALSRADSCKQLSQVLRGSVHYFSGYLEV